MYPTADVFTNREAPITREELVTLSGTRHVRPGEPMDDAIELVVELEEMNVLVRVIPPNLIEGSLASAAFRALDDSTFDDPRLPDDLTRAKQRILLVGYCDRDDRDAGRARLLSLAKALASHMGGLASAEGAFFDAKGERRGAPKLAESSRPTPPSPLRVARRALIACALAERARTDLEIEGKTRVRAYATIRRFIHAHGIAAELTPEERTYIDLLPIVDVSFGLGPFAIDRAEWGYEAVGVFAWALGVARLPRAIERADPALAEKLGYRGSERPRVLDRAQLRPHREILGLVEQMKDADALRDARPRDYEVTLEDVRFESIAVHRRRAARWLLGLTESYADASGRPFSD